MSEMKINNQNRNILIIDDELSNLKTLTDLLISEGYEVRGATDGPTGLMIIENDPPDLILLDIKMPVMDGHEVCRRLKEKAQTKDIPLLFLSVMDDARDKVNAFHSGALDYITKPFQAEEVLARIKTHLTLNHLKRDLQVQVENQTSELKEYAKKLEMMEYSVDNALDRITWNGPDGRFLYANEAACKGMNYSLQEVLAMTVSDVDPHFPSEKWDVHFQKVKQAGSILLETQQADGDGKIHDIEVSTNYLQFGDQEFICSFGKDITERKRIEKELDELFGFEQLVADIATDLAMTTPENLDKNIDDVLRRLCTFLGTERSFLARFSSNGKSLAITNYWPAEKYSSSSRVLQVDVAVDAPWAAEQIRNGESIVANPDFTTLPPEAETLRKKLNKDGINSGVVVPMLVENTSLGMLGLDTIRTPRKYPPALVERLKTLADMIGSTLQRVRTQMHLQQHKHIIESTSSIISMVNRQYVYQHVNNACVEAFKKDRDQIVGHTAEDLLGKRLFNQVKPFYDHCFKGEEITYQSWMELPGQGNRFMDVRYSPYINFDGKISAVVASIHDITQAKQLEEKLQESEGIFREFAENIPAVVYLKDDKDRHVYVNHKGAAATLLTPHEIIGKTTECIWPKKLAEKLIKTDRQVLSGKSSKITVEWQNTDKGDRRWYQDIKFPIIFDSGKKLLGGIAIDITQLKKKEEDLKHSYREIKKLKNRLEQDNQYLRSEYELTHGHEDIVGESSVIKQVKEDIEQVAPSNATVLITGETGTGKELVAHSIHKYSQRSNKSLIKLNCAALPPTLIEAELFGREKGAYTGALTKQIGRFELADGATIFLDEIGDLPLELQGKILRVLESGEFERLGGHKPLKTDARVIAATNKNLADEVSSGRFREDLFYRLNVFPIHVPPLRERKQDIAMLVWYFLQELSSGMGKTINNVSQSTMDKLQSYPWPGNVRELKNVIERGLIVSGNGTLQIDISTNEPQPSEELLSLEEVNKRHIITVLEKTGWKVRGKNGAAEILIINPQTLESRMKKLGIIRPASHTM